MVHGFMRKEPHRRFELWKGIRKPACSQVLDTEHAVNVRCRGWLFDQGFLQQAYRSLMIAG